MSWDGARGRVSVRTKPHISAVAPPPSPLGRCLLREKSSVDMSTVTYLEDGPSVLSMYEGFFAGGARDPAHRSRPRARRHHASATQRAEPQRPRAARVHRATDLLRQLLPPPDLGRRAGAGIETYAFGPDHHQPAQARGAVGGEGRRRALPQGAAAHGAGQGRHVGDSADHLPAPLRPGAPGCRGAGAHRPRPGRAADRGGVVADAFQRALARQQGSRWSGCRSSPTGSTSTSSAPTPSCGPASGPSSAWTATHPW